jgi:1,4-alpha-glucan branching enzyme
MNDTLYYFQKDPLFRHYHHNNLSFGLLYAFSERFMLVLSHDEVVHGKRSLLSKMPGDRWQQFANMRLLYSYMICQPGKKLLFMSGEIGQWNEWHCKSEVEWHLLQYEPHKKLQHCLRALNHFYKNHPPLFECDFNWRGFEWVNLSDLENSVISYNRRTISGESLFCLHHFTPTFVPHYVIHVPGAKKVEELFNTDAEEYGGSGKINPEIELVSTEPGKIGGFAIKLAPLATQIFKISYA